VNPEFQKALDFSKYQQTLNVKIQNLQDRAQSNLTLGYNGGLFFVDQTLIAFVKTLIDFKRITDVVLLDSNQKPILIADLNDFQTEILDRYFTVTNQYLEEYSQIKKQRSVEKLLDD